MKSEAKELKRSKCLLAGAASSLLTTALDSNFDESMPNVFCKIWMSSERWVDTKVRELSRGMSPRGRSTLHGLSYKSSATMQPRVSPDTLLRKVTKRCGSAQADSP